MITYLQAIIIGLVQGATELFPVSSLGHSVILPVLFGWHINQQDQSFLTLLVALHLGTALVLLGFFWKDWVRIITGMGRSFVAREVTVENSDAKLGWLLVVGTVPAGIIGVLFQDQIAGLFASAEIAALFLILNGVLLYGAEVLRKRAPQDEDPQQSTPRIARLSWLQSIGIGTMQALALLPGFSRSGASMTGSLWAGLSNEDAARFSFLLATPIILAASLLKLPDFALQQNHSLIGPALVGTLCASITAYFSVRFLLKFFQTNRLTPFALYCVIAGVTFSLLLLA